MRYRIEFSKQQAARFVSHLDTMKTLERAIRRGRIPIAFSEGFNPHPKMSFGSALAVGVTSDQEFLDLELSSDWDPAQLQAALSNSLPSGYQVQRVIRVSPGSPSLMSVINRADYLTKIRLDKPLTEEAFARLINDFLACPEIWVEKKSKRGKKQVNLRPGIYQLTGQVEGDALILRMLLQSGSEGNVRPEEVLAALQQFAAIKMDVTAASLHRRALYVDKGEKLLSPLEV